MKKIMMFVIALITAGCAGIPLSSVYKMITANPLEFHPDAVSIAIKSSNTIQMNTGDVKMTLFIKSNDPVIKVKQEYFLVVNNKAQIPLLASNMKNNEELTLLTLSSEDVIRMKKLQSLMKNHLINGGDEDDFGFAVEVLEGCKKTINIPKDVFTSVFLKLDLRSEFFPLYENFNLAQEDLAPLNNVVDWAYCEH